jgi:transcriptional regulator with XRE-family HTH domain
MAANDKGRTFFEIPSLTNAQINTEIIKAKIATEIISCRKELKMNQSEFANYMNVSQAMVSKWENGECNFSISTVCEICDKLSLNIDLQISMQENYKNAESVNSWDGITLGAFGIISPTESDDEEMVA